MAWWLEICDGTAFRLDEIGPADDPAYARLSGPGVTLLLTRAEGVPPTVQLEVSSPPPHARLLGPAGCAVELVPCRDPGGPRDASLALDIPPVVPALVVSSAADDVEWSAGRAGMQYRDLLPERHGGAFIASRIRIPTGGEVGDYVHYHHVHFQLIFCLRGSVRLVYEDQGEPFDLNPGDCILQPPTLRHRVLSCSDGLEVLEIGCPAQHATMREHAVLLPNGADALPHPRRYGGQRFVRHVAAASPSGDERAAGAPRIEWEDTDVESATDGVASVRVGRFAGAASDEWSSPLTHAADFALVYVLRGACTLEVDESAWGAARRHALVRDDCFVVPARLRHRLLAPSADLEVVQVHCAAAAADVANDAGDEQ